MRWYHRLLVLWTMAAAIHLPVPVGDGDNLKSGESLLARAAHSSCWDVDFILLGCDPPDDCDDGPVDDDPESSSGSPLRSYLVHASVAGKSLDLSAAVRLGTVDELITRHVVGRLGRGALPRSSGRRGVLDFSFGKSCQCGWAVMRC